VATAAEKLNNAIVRLDFVAQGAPITFGRKSAIGDLSRAWQLFWDSGERHLFDDTALQPRYARFLEWYARAWLLLPPASRPLAPDPREIDVSYLTLADGVISRAIDAYASAGAAGVEAARAAAEAAKGAAKELGAVGNWVLWAGGIAAVVLVAYGYAQSSTARAAAA